MISETTRSVVDQAKCIYNAQKKAWEASHNGGSKKSGRNRICKFQWNQFLPPFDSGWLAPFEIVSRRRLVLSAELHVTSTSYHRNGVAVRDISRMTV